MIEFLDEKGKIHKEYTLGNEEKMIRWDVGTELCDALWEDVVEVLEKV